MISEFVQNGSLYELIHLRTKSTGLAYEVQMKVALEIACGMAYLHSKKILHCDLKSMNIMLG
jgi:serine/threonine protein kinase